MTTNRSEVPDPRRARAGASIAVVSFLVSASASVAVTIVYSRGGSPRLEGLFLGLAFAGLGVGLVTWAHRLLPRGPYVEPRPELATSPSERAAMLEDLERGGVLTRRRVLLGSLVTATVAFAGAAVFPLRSLGPQPGDALRRTPWRRGTPLVDDEGRQVRVDQVPVGGLVTVFPEHHVGSADGQALLLRLDRGVEPQGAPAPDGFLVYSKICTHAGCPVGLYEVQLQQLLCPCHQSAFDVLREAEPVSGPAARALPRLPIEVADDGVLRALGDFPEPVGPAWWFR